MRSLKCSKTSVTAWIFKASLKRYVVSKFGKDSKSVLGLVQFGYFSMFWGVKSKRRVKMDQNCKFELIWCHVNHVITNYSSWHQITESPWRRVNHVIINFGESQWTKLVFACICRHAREEVVDQTWNPRVVSARWYYRIFLPLDFGRLPLRRSKTYFPWLITYESYLIR